MNRDPTELMTPRILVVDDERQIHASLRLRLGSDYDVVCRFDAREALAVLAQERFDLCFVDIHMPKMDGLAFITEAQQIDPALGYVVLSAFDTEENLRRTIPLQVFAFVGKPFPERHEFEARIPDWIDRTRKRRHDQALAQQGAAHNHDLESARLERDIELVASETARDALLQTAGLLTTIHAHFVTATAAAAARAKTDVSLTPLWRNLEEGRKTAEAAASIAEGFFDSAYANRDSSPALVDSGLRHAIGIAMRMCRAEAVNKAVDFTPIDPRLTIRGLSGIDFLLMMVPAIGAALALVGPDSTIGVQGEHLPRLDAISRDLGRRGYLWVNRKHAPTSQPGVLISVTANVAPFSQSEAAGWLSGSHVPLAAVTPRGLTAGIQKCRGVLGMSLSPGDDRFRLVLALPI